MFTKEDDEQDVLVKDGKTYFPSSAINKLWRFVLHVIVYYVTLDEIFSWVSTHHFIILNPFMHAIKISISFYLYTSMNDNIHGIRDRVFTNPLMHEGLMLLIYEYFKSHSISKKIAEKGESEIGDVDSISQHAFSKTKDSEDMHSEDLEATTTKGKGKVSSSKQNSAKEESKKCKITKMVISSYG